MSKGKIAAMGELLVEVMRPEADIPTSLTTRNP